MEWWNQRQYVIACKKLALAYAGIALVYTCCPTPTCTNVTMPSLSLMRANTSRQLIILQQKQSS